ncbi:hypothetical protein DNTS_004595, partial [Danionella cerebrum]
MKRPKRQSQPLSFLNFFSRKPKTEPRIEKPSGPFNREEVAITLMPSEQERVEQDHTFSDTGLEGSSNAGDNADNAGADADEGSAEYASKSPGSVQTLSTSSQEQVLECPLCLLSQPQTHFPSLSCCQHRACNDCLRQYLLIEISESRICIACPQCPESLALPDVRAILDDRVLLERFEEFQLRRFLAADPDTRCCPAPDCR